MPAPRSAVRRAAPMALALLALLASSCSRELPGAPMAPALGHSPSRPSSRGGGGTGVENEVVVTLVPDAVPAELAADFSATVVEFDAAQRTATLASAIGQAPADLALALALDRRVITTEANDFLESAESRQQSFAFDDGRGTPQTFAEQPAALALGLDEAHVTSQGNGVTIAFLDTGVDPQHAAFSGRLAPGWDFVGRDADPTEETNGIDDDNDGHVDEAHGHGTHVAGILTLTAPAARLMPIRVLDADGRGDVLAVAAGVRFAVQHGANVINLSLGMLHNSDAIQNALEEAEYAGVIVIAAAGNWGAANPEEYPASSSHAHAIAATDASAHPATFTSYMQDVVLSAPGVGVRSAYPGGGWRLWSGTSMAAPFVAGSAAILLQLHPGWTAAQVFDRLGSTARALQGVNPPQVGRLGAGMLDVAAAVASERPGGPDGPATPGDVNRRPR